MYLFPTDARSRFHLGDRLVSPRGTGILFHLWNTLEWDVEADAVATATGVTTVNIPKVGPYIERIRVTHAGVELPVTYYCQTDPGSARLGPLAFEHLSRITGRTIIAEDGSTGFRNLMFRLEARIESSESIRIEILVQNVILASLQSDGWHWAARCIWGHDDSENTHLSSGPPAPWHGELMERLAAEPVEPSDS